MILKLLSEFVADARYGLRAALRHRWPVAIAIVSLAVGISVQTLLFGLLNSLIFRDLPVQAPAELITLAAREKGASEPGDLSYLDYLDYRKQSSTLLDICAYQIRVEGLAAGGKADRVVTTYVTGNYFSLLGAHPEVGRLTQSGEGVTPGSDPVIVLGYAYWQRRFNGDPGIVGKGVSVNGRAVTVIGVTPKHFRGAHYLALPDAYLPLSQLPVEDRSLLTDRGIRGKGNLAVLARRKSSAQLEQVRAEIRVISRQLSAEYPLSNGNIEVEAYNERLSRPQPSAAPLWPPVIAIILTVGACVFVAAAVNAINALCAVVAERQTEFAIRFAMGASRSRLVRQMTVEGFLIAAMGGGLGLFAGGELLRANATTLVPPDLPWLYVDLSFDWRVYLFVLACIVIFAAAAGVFASRSWAGDLRGILNQVGRSSSSRAALRLRGGLVTIQVAVSAVLLISALLLLRGLWTARTMDLGFNAQNLINVTVNLKLAGYDQERGLDFYRSALDSLRSLPGVTGASMSYAVPLGRYQHSGLVFLEGQPSGMAISRTGYNCIGPDYLRLLHIPIIEGREFAASDQGGAPKVAIVSAEMARRFWPRQDAIGNRFALFTRSGPIVTVVGVAADAKLSSLTQSPSPYFYVPMAQNYSPLLTFQIRTALPLAAIGPRIRDRLNQLDPNVPIFEMVTMEAAMNGIGGFFLLRAAAYEAALLALLGLLLTGVGLYGLMSYATAARVSEVAIRKSFGASDAQIRLMLLKDGMRLLGVGIVAGAVSGFVVIKLLQGFLVGLETSATVSLFAALMIISLIGITSCFFPAYRASKVDILSKLRGM